MLLIWKLVDETQMSKPHEYTGHHDSRKLLILVPLRAIYFSTFQYETPCSKHRFLRKIIQTQISNFWPTFWWPQWQLIILLILVMTKSWFKLRQTFLSNLDIQDIFSKRCDGSISAQHKDSNYWATLFRSWCLLRSF